MKRLTIEDMQNIAKMRGGVCLSNIYINNSTPLIWQCANGHVWETRLGHIRNGSWCRKCVQLKHDIGYLQELAISKGGKCLSKNYLGMIKKYKWQCHSMHVWETRAAHVIDGSWCPYCCSGLGERICREYFEQMSGYRFPKCYPSWLKTKKGSKLELDGYCENLKIAFEHQGRQHYFKNNYFGGNEEFTKRIENDKRKVELCSLNEVQLILIPELIKFTKLKNLKSLIEQESKRLKIDCFDFSKEICLKNAYMPEYISKLKKIAKQRGGRLISETYLGSETHMEWECILKHRWQAAPLHITSSKSWCPICYRLRRKGNLSEFHELAKSRRSKFLSNKYSNKGIKLDWRCEKGHAFSLSYEELHSGFWCFKCFVYK